MICTKISTGRFKAIDDLRRNARINGSLDEDPERFKHLTSEAAEQECAAHIPYLLGLSKKYY